MGMAEEPQPGPSNESEPPNRTDQQFPVPANGGFKAWLRTFAAWLMFLIAWCVL